MGPRLHKENSRHNEMVTSTSWGFNIDVPIPTAWCETLMYHIQSAPCPHLVTLAFSIVPNETLDLYDS